jgi:glycosyltransferase involved in cell wall biosynthesis
MTNQSRTVTNGNPWLSVLIPIYNVEEFLGECVRSILDQSVADIEIVIVDDCSTDGSCAMASAMRDAYPEKIKLIKLAKNSGVSIVRNTLLNAARGEYIWFVDPDDFVLPGSFAQLKKIVNSKRPDIISCNYEKDSKRKNAYKGRSQILERNRAKFVAGVLASRKLYCWIKITRRSIWPAKLRFPVGRYFEDVAIIPLLMLRARSFYHSDAIWVHYRTRKDSILSSIRHKHLFDTAKNWDLAIALDGYSSAIDANFPAGADRENIRYSASSFLGTEFTKITWRILRSRKTGNGCRSRFGLIYRFWDHMNRNAPMPFAELLKTYRKKGDWGRYAILLICCFLAHWGEKFDLLP